MGADRLVMGLPPDVMRIPQWTRISRTNLDLPVQSPVRPMPSARVCNTVPWVSVPLYARRGAGMSDASLSSRTAYDSLTLSNTLV